MNSRAALEVHPDVEWQTLDVFPDTGTYRGPEAVLEFFQSWRETFKALQLHLENCIPVGDQDGRRHLAGKWGGSRKRSSGGVPDVRSGSSRFANGVLIRSRMFQTEAEALEAAGLRK